MAPRASPFLEHLFIFRPSFQSPTLNAHCLSLCLFPLLCFGAKHAFPVVKLLFIIVTCQNIHHFCVRGTLTKCFKRTTVAKKRGNTRFVTSLRSVSCRTRYYLFRMKKDDGAS